MLCGLVWRLVTTLLKTCLETLTGTSKVGFSHVSLKWWLWKQVRGFWTTSNWSYPKCGHPSCPVVVYPSPRQLRDQSFISSIRWWNRLWHFYRLAGVVDDWMDRSWKFNDNTILVVEVASVNWPSWIHDTRVMHAINKGHPSGKEGESKSRSFASALKYQLREALSEPSSTYNWSWTQRDSDGHSFHFWKGVDVPDLERSTHLKY